MKFEKRKLKGETYTVITIKSNEFFKLINFVHLPTGMFKTMTFSEFYYSLFEVQGKNSSSVQTDRNELEGTFVITVSGSPDNIPVKDTKAARLLYGV